MDIQSIAEFIEIHLRQLRNVNGLNISLRFTETNINPCIRVDYENEYYSAETSIWRNRTFAVNAVDLQKLEVMFDDNDQFENLEDLVPYLKKIERLFISNE